MKMLRSRSAFIARLLAVAAAGMLGACASPQVAYNSDVDYAKVAQVERAARLLGTQVIWVRYPTKRTDSATQ